MGDGPLIPLKGIWASLSKRFLSEEGWVQSVSKEPFSSLGEVNWKGRRKPGLQGKEERVLGNPGWKV